MDLLFQVLNGRSAGQQLRLSPSEVRKVGRGPGADLVLPYDSALAEVHFALQYLDQVCRIRAWANTRTLLNGQVTTAAVLQDGDQVEAGGTRFLCRFVGAARKAGQAPTLSAFLVEQPEPAFALLDAARSPEIPELLRDLAPDHRSLFSPNWTEQLRPVAPYLAPLPAGSKLPALLADLSWGKSWGVFLTSPQPFADVRRHLQGLLQVEQESYGPLYFRYYDPRVLRAFLPTCTEAEGVEFFGPIARFLVEDETPGKFLQFVPRQGGVARQQVALARG